MPDHLLRIVGVPGSPYSCKLRAVLRYRRIPHAWITQGSPESRGLPLPRVPLLPQLIVAGADGTVAARTDSTPLIRELEALHAGRSVIPGGWKLQVSERPRKDWLFHRDDDPSERVDLAATHAEQVQELKALLAAHEAEMVPPAWPSLLAGSIAIDHPLGVPERANDEYVYWEN